LRRRARAYRLTLHDVGGRTRGRVPGERDTLSGPVALEIRRRLGRRRSGRLPAGIVRGAQEASGARSVRAAGDQCIGHRRAPAGGGERQYQTGEDAHGRGCCGPPSAIVNAPYRPIVRSYTENAIGLSGLAHSASAPRMSLGPTSWRPREHGGVGSERHQPPECSAIASISGGERPVAIPFAELVGQGLDDDGASRMAGVVAGLGSERDRHRHRCLARSITRAPPAPPRARWAAA
jgi:hypothetical protein